MAKYKAVQGFTGIATMKKDEVRDFNPREPWVRDLIKFGFIEPVEEPKAEKKEEAKEPEKKAKAKKSTK